MKIKQIVNLASFYAKKVKNGEFETNRAKQGRKTAEKSVSFLLKIVQKNSFREEKSM